MRVIQNFWECSCCKLTEHHALMRVQQEWAVTFVGEYATWHCAVNIRTCVTHAFVRTFTCAFAICLWTSNLSREEAFCVSLRKSTTDTLEMRLEHKPQKCSRGCVHRHIALTFWNTNVTQTLHLAHCSFILLTDAFQGSLLMISRVWHFMFALCVNLQMCTCTLSQKIV